MLHIEFEVSGYRFIAIYADPDVTVNPSISMMINFDPAHDPMPARTSTPPGSG